MSDDDHSVRPCARSAYERTIKLVQMLPTGAERETALRASELLSDVINGLRRQVTFDGDQSNPPS